MPAGWQACTVMSGFLLMRATYVNTPCMQMRYVLVHTALLLRFGLLSDTVLTAAQCADAMKIMRISPALCETNAMLPVWL